MDTTSSSSSSSPKIQLSIPALVITVSVLCVLVLFVFFCKNTNVAARSLDDKLSLQHIVGTLALIVAYTATTAPPVALDALLLSLERLELLNRPDRSVYVFIVDDTGSMVLNGGNPRIGGRTAKNFTGYKDSDGNEVIALIANKAATGGGFVTYKWPHPGRDGVESKKVTYVQTVPGTKWVIGAGLYVD